LQDLCRFVRFPLDVKPWQASMPSAEAARPSRCGACGAASRVVGEALSLHGHGLRRRQFYELLRVDAPAVAQEVLLRRYRCLRCGGITTVGPRGLVRRHLYGLGTIMVALWMWAMLGLPAPEVRDRVRPWRRSGDACAGRWASLRRWARRLPWPSTLRLPPGLRPREMARRRVQAALSYAPTGPPDAAAVMAGCAHDG